MFTYAYFIGGLILAITWVIFFLLRRDLKSALLFGGLLGLPFGLTEFLFIPEYWNPPSVFNLIATIGFGVESLMFAFFTGGIAATSYKVVFGKTVEKATSEKRGFSMYIFSLVLFVGLELFFPNKSIYNLIVTFSVVAVLIVMHRKDLFRQVLLNAVLFSLIYSFLFVLFRQLFPSYIEQVYSLENFLGITLFGLPVEEPLFALSVGACWSSLYEYILGYKVIS